MEKLTLVTGSEGLVGSRFVDLFPQKKLLHSPKRIEFDICKPTEVKAILKSFDFGTVVNFAAFTDVGEAEKQRDDKSGDCWQVNVEGVRSLVEAIDPTKIHFIQISADLVFPGTVDDPGPYLENHPAETDSNKLMWCGFTKAEAERVILQKLGEKASILRLTNPVRANFSRTDYVRRRLELFDQQKLYPLFDDQQISISYIDEACRALEKIILGNVRGIFHAGSSNTTTPYDLMSYVLEEAREAQRIKSIGLEEYLKKSADPRRFPKYGGLSVDMTEQKLGMKFSSWRGVVDKLISQGLGQK